MSAQRPIEDLYPLSPMQQGMLFHALYAPRAGLHVWQVSARLSGRLDGESFRRALATLVERHPVLRTSFLWEELEQPLQVVDREVPLPLDERDWSALAGEERHRALEEHLAADLARGFDLGQAPLMRLLLAREAEERHRLVWTTHLLLVDGWSMSALIRELFVLYEVCRAGGEPRLPAPRRYRDYIAWLQRQSRDEAERFWRRELEGIASPTPVPGLRPMPAETADPQAAAVDLPLGEEATAALQALARRHQITLNTLVQGAWALLLARGCGEAEVVFGVTVSGRPPELPGVESMVGLFINTLPMRAEVDPEARLEDWLRRLQERAAEARRFEHTPLVDVQGWSGVPRGVSLFDTLVVFENYPVEGAMGGNAGSLAVADVRLTEITNYPLTLQVTPGDSLSLRLAYHRSRFEAAAAGRTLAHLATLLASMAAGPERRLGELAELASTERHQILAEWNDTSRPYEIPPAGTLTELLAAQAARTPEEPAVVCAGTAVSYRELDRRATRLANRLRQLGCGPDVPVGILMERSVEMVVALCAVLKAGGAYLPLDPDHPRERLGWMLADSGLSILLAQERLLDRLPEHAARVITLEAGWRGDEADDDGSTCNAAGGENLAYVLYTSGSTGRPKAVMVPHQGIVNRLLWMQEAYGLTSRDRVLQKTPYSFDVSVWEFFWPLMTGAALVMARPGGHRDAAYLAGLIARERITVLHFVPSMLQVFLEEPDLAGCGSLRLVVASGEALPPELRQRFRRRLARARLENLYGPTEAAVDVTAWSCESEAAHGVVPIGRPIANLRIHLLDPRREPVPVGVAGELCIAGSGLARGYLARPDLTAERFVPDPFAEIPGERLYRTGDLARHLPDGNVEFLGRLDHQVKVRGFRVELGEIEAVLAAQPGVREAVVLARGDGDGAAATLVAYVVPQADAAPAPAALREALRERLPEPMVPAGWVLLPALPLSPNGKVDRRALARYEPAPAAGAPASEEARPRGEVEEIVAQAWREVLRLDRVGRNDNFFDLGGHSLLLVQVQGKLRKALGRDLELVDLFRHPTVAAMAAFLAPATTPAERREIVSARPARPVDGAEGGRVAIVGMAGRFPGARDLAAFWRNLRDGVESIARLTDADLDAAGVDAAARNDPNYVRAAGLLEAVDRFDADFFGYTPRDAEITDPQHRLFLEVAWEALEDAGYDPAAVRGEVGVFAGVSMNGYLFNLYSSPEIVGTVGPYRVSLANDKDYLTTTVSYKLDLRGPSLDVQTACSTSLVAVHLACRALLAGECDMALVGGSSISLPHGAGYLYQEGGIRSPDGHCRAFDARAQGMVGGSGAGAVVLKRLEDALADGDAVRAVILGSAINNDGSLKVGFTAPSVDGQARVISAALAAAGADPRGISYVEAHGTGTPLGDPIEVTALTLAYRAATEDCGFCALGSVKTNVGHLDAAAGVAGLIKTVLALEHRQLPPSLHYEAPNPAIDFASSPFHVNAGLNEWRSVEGPRRAGVSSFGIGGTNAHMILEEAPVPAAVEASRPARPWRLLTLSARTPAALETATANLLRALEERPELDLDDVAYTLQVGRRAFAQRRAVVCRDVAGFAATLAGGDADALRTDEAPEDGRAPDGGRGVVFLFPGQGAQHPGMGHDLYLREPVYREELDRAAEILRPRLGLDLRQLIAPDAAAEALADTAVAQPALFAVEHALARLWMSWGVHPEAMLGHSLGEYVAACLAGVLSLEDALGLVAERGRLVARLAGPGGMASVPLSEEEAAALLTPGLALAAVNGPAQCVISGPEEELRPLLDRLASFGVEGRRLRTSHAFHSALMEPPAAALAAVVEKVKLQPPRIPYVSNVTGTWIRDSEATDPAYWARHLQSTVRFAAGLGAVLSPAGRNLLEVGPGRTLAALARRHPERAAAHAVLTSLRAPDEKGNGGDGERMASALGRLWASGAAVDWRAYHAGEHRRRVPLPTYPFERRRYWIEPGAVRREPAPAAGSLERRPPEEWLYAPYWKPAPLPPPADSGGAPWLVFLDGAGLGSRVLAHLRRTGVEAVAVEPGAELAPKPGVAWTIDPRRRQDYDDLLARAFPGPPPSRVLHLWSVSPPVEQSLEALERAQDLGLYSVLYLLQSLAERGLAPGLRLLAVTSDAVAVPGGDLRCPEKATLGGLCRTVPREYPGVECRHVDISLPEGIPQRRLDALAERLVAEALAASEEPVVAWRNGERYVQRFDPLTLDAAALPADAAYLITGGLGSVGLAMAERLADEGPVRLALVSRSGLPPETEWEVLLAEDAADAAGDPDLAPERLAGRDVALRSELGVRGMASQAGMEAALDAWCAARIHRFFVDSGFDVSRGARHRIEEIEQRLRLLPKFSKMLRFFLRTLAADGYARFEEETVTFERAPDAVPDPARLAREAGERYPSLRPLLALVERCASQYGPALSGEVEAVGVIFAGGSDEATAEDEGLSYEPVYSALAAEVAAQVAERAAGRGEKIRVLEFGGGQGRLTRLVAPALAGRAAEYWFTDLGRIFVTNAEKEAARQGLDSLMRFARLDISADPGPQGFAPESFDLLLGLNVVHATRDVEESLRNLRRLLRPGGTLCLIETIKRERWVEMVWGLAEGWWYFDDALRTDSPVLPMDGWHEALRRSGFEVAAALPRDATGLLNANCGMILATRPGAEAARGGVAGRIARVRRLREMGAEVLVEAADVTDPAALRAAARRAAARFGRLDGVLHAAAVNGGGVLGLQTRESLSAELAPKLRGTLALGEVCRELEPGFLALFSSLSSFTAPSGAAGDGAASSFLDAYAHAFRAATGLPALAIDWDRWDAGSLQPAEGFEVLRRALASGLSQVIVSTVDLPSRLTRLRTPEDSGALARLAARAPSSLHARPDLGVAYASPSDDFERQIAGLWEEVFAIEGLGVHDDFFALGGDSLVAIQLASRLGRAFGVELRVRDLFETPTIAGLALKIEEAMFAAAAPEEIDQVLDEMQVSHE